MLSLQPVSPKRRRRAVLRSEDFRFLAAVASAESLAATARKLNVTPSAVTQRLAALEAQLGVKLVLRTGRGTILTDEGQLMLSRGDEILAEIEHLHTNLSNRRSAVEGHLRVLAPFGFGRTYIAALCGRFAQLYPKAAVSLDLAENLSNQPTKAWDIAIHIGTLIDSNLIRHRIAPHRRLLVASPAYLAKTGVPRSIEELGHHNCLLIRENAEDSGLWRFSGPSGDRAIRVKSLLSSNDGEVVRDWLLAGLGVALRSEWSIGRDVAAGRLVELLPDWKAPDTDIVALVGPTNARTARVRKFLEHLSAELGRRPWLSIDDPDYSADQSCA